LLVAAGALWLAGGTAAGDGGLGKLVAAAQSARSQARAALGGDSAAFDRVAAIREQLKRGRAELGANSQASSAARLFTADGGAWNGVEQGLDQLMAARPALTELNGARAEVLNLAPQLLAATGNLASSLAPQDLATNQPSLERLELTVEAIQQNLRSLGSGGSATDVGRRLGDEEQFLGQIIRGLRGEDSSLGIAAARGQAAQASLETANRSFEQVRKALGVVVADAAQLTAAEQAAATLDAAADAVLDRYSNTDLGGSASSTVTWLDRLPVLLVLAGLLMVVLMLLLYYRSRDLRTSAELQAAQNERNQQAILRLLDELSSLADGDLTVQATVTEDITGAIADSINYAIEALRELVATINESSILVDAAAKQTEGTSRQLLRASETQAKQAAAASESMARMAASIEEVSGNAERCSDVARHSVEVAHKGGEAVRRTIAGMNTIRETIQDTSKRIKRLGESSQEIGNIVELIEEIAEQTNILALNASIEASRAGEASRGFAVVADEVQKLAERSTNATKKIEVLVSTIQSDTNEAVVSMERSTTDVVGGALLAENAGAALDEIEQVSHQIASLVHNISGSSKEQSSVAGAITKNMHVLREVSSKTSESTAATSSAISKLSELASQLRKSVAGFALPDQGGGTGVLSAARVAANLASAADAAPADDTAAGVPERRRLSG
jgi:twitching motility protein PilJ